MAYNEPVAERLRQILPSDGSVQEKQMFGGVAFMVSGHMCVGVNKDNLMVRVGPDQYEGALERPHARPMDFTGKPLRGFVYVAPSGYGSAASLNEWVQLGRNFVSSLPPK